MYTYGTDMIPYSLCFLGFSGMDRFNFFFFLRIEIIVERYAMKLSLKVVDALTLIECFPPPSQDINQISSYIGFRVGGDLVLQHLEYIAI